MSIGAKVRDLRIASGMTQEELAKKLGYASRVSVNKIECGRPVTQKIVVKLADALNTTPQYLMGWESDTVPQVSDIHIDNADSDLNEVISRFTSLSDEHKGVVLGLLRALSGTT